MHLSDHDQIEQNMVHFPGLPREPRVPELQLRAQILQSAKSFKRLHGWPITSR